MIFQLYAGVLPGRFVKFLACEFISPTRIIVSNFKSIGQKVGGYGYPTRVFPIDVESLTHRTYNTVSCTLAISVEIQCSL